MEESRSITRKSASNLALAFVLLPKAKREGMTALYAFCREVDDVADDESVPVAERRSALARWRDDIAQACQGGEPRFPVNRELQHVIAAHRLSFALFDELIRGVEMDLDIKRYASFELLEQYCYRVASVVGLLSIEIFGYRNPACRIYADHLGKALQLTNILRDVRADAERGRIYLPHEELARCGVTEEEILRFEYSDRFRQLAERVAERARQHYREAHAPTRGPTLDGGRRTHGVGLLAAARQARSRAVPGAGPRTDAPQPGPKTRPYFSHLVSHPLRRAGSQLWHPVTRAVPGAWS
jgi:phytoene synthase